MVDWNNKRVLLLTLGCKINQYESRLIKEKLLTLGASFCRQAEQADYVLINTCAVTASAVADLRAICRRLARANNATSIIVTGCAAQIIGEALYDLPGVRAVLPQRDKFALASHGAWPAPAANSSLEAEANLFDPFADGLGIKDYDNSRAVVKIQDGCSQRCTYCIVPLARGPARSREPGLILAEIETLFQAGFAEVVLSGVNLGQFGLAATPAADFWDLLSFLESRLADRWAGQARLRISSLDPGQLTPKGLKILADSVMICPHLHLSLQSASPKILARMGRRHYTPGEVAQMVENLHSIWPLFALGADILVGFPGEEAADFRQTLDFCQALPLSYAHVFPYSKRPGTVAAAMPEQIDPQEKKRRAALIRELAQNKKSAFGEKLSRLPRLQVTSTVKNPEKGMSQYYVPCRILNYIKLPPACAIFEGRPRGLHNGELLVEPCAGNQ